MRLLLLLLPAGVCGLATATRRMPSLIRLLGVVVCLNAAAGAAELRLASPLACGPADGCSIQNYVDVEPGPGVQDFACGVLSYDGHRGTDFQVPDLKRMRRGVAVLAAASGVVLRYCRYNSKNVGASSSSMRRSAARAFV
mgnify:CR=1 FL=1